MVRLFDRDFLTAVVLFIVGGVAWFSAGGDVKNWIFPLLAIYLILGIAAALLARVIFSSLMSNVPDVVDLSSEDQTVLFDVLVFLVIVLAYMFVMYGLGFWLASFLLLSSASMYLTLDKTRRNLALALIVPLAACAAAYFIFLHVFYVPFPKATWWVGLS
ncbi:MAG: tripartite tricarboxylate transporter TctB family protein [Hyphomicrobiaceae bacterium]